MEKPTAVFIRAVWCHWWVRLGALSTIAVLLPVPYKFAWLLSAGFFVTALVVAAKETNRYFAQDHANLESLLAKEREALISDFAKQRADLLSQIRELKAFDEEQERLACERLAHLTLNGRKVLAHVLKIGAVSANGQRFAPTITFHDLMRGELLQSDLIIEYKGPDDRPVWEINPRFKAPLEKHLAHDALPTRADFFPGE